jgi:hypothetical protein
MVSELKLLQLLLEAPLLLAKLLLEVPLVPLAHG